MKVPSNRKLPKPLSWALAILAILAFAAAPTALVLYEASLPIVWKDPGTLEIIEVTDADLVTLTGSERTAALKGRYTVEFRMPQTY